MANILFWQGAISHKNHLESYQAEIQELINNPTSSGLHLEKLANSNLYSIRANDTIRLLITTYKINDKAYVLILKALEQHQYEKEKLFIEKGEAQFIHKYQDQLTLETLKSCYGEFILQESETEAEEDLLSLLAKIKVNLIKEPILKFDAARYLDTKFLIFNEAQNICHQSTLPLILNGIAGSGKTLVLHSMLKQALLSRSHTENLNIYGYIAPHPRLVNDMQIAISNTLNKHGIAYKSDENIIEAFGKKILFLTYQQLEDRAFEPIGKIRIHEDEIIDILRSKIEDKAKRHTPKSAKKTSSPSKSSGLLNPYDVLKEIHLIAGLPGTQNEKFARYLMLGQKQSLYPMEEDKLHIIELYQSLSQFLKEGETLYPAFYDEALPAEFDALFIDEAQGLSLANIALLDKLADGRILLCTDTNQNWDSLFSVTELYKHVYQAVPRTISQIDLSFSYRNSLNVTQVANSILRLKSHLIGAANNRHEFQQIEPASNSTGELIWLDEAYRSNHNTQHQAYIEDPEFAVIIFRPNDMSTALLTYPKYRIFYPEQIQGLEYEHVLLFNPFDRNMLHLFEKSYGDVLLSPKAQKLRHNRSRQDSFTEQTQFICSFLKKLFIGATRARTTLLLCQTNLGAKNTDVLKMLFGLDLTTPSAIKSLGSPIAITEAYIEKTTTMALLSPSEKYKWYKEAIKIFKTQDESNIENARLILREKLDYSEREIEQFFFKNTARTEKSAALMPLSPEKTSSPKSSIPSKFSPNKKEENKSLFFYKPKDELNEHQLKALEIYIDLLEIKRKKDPSQVVNVWLMEKTIRIKDLEKFLKEGWQTIKSQPTWMNEDEDLTFILIEKIKAFIYRLNIEHWHDNKKITLAAVSKLGVLLKDASPRLKQDFDVCMAAVISYPRILTEVSQATHRYIEIVYTALFDEPSLLEKLGCIASGTADASDPYYLACIHTIKDAPKALAYCLYDYRHMPSIATIAIINEPSTISFIDPQHPIYISLFYISKIKKLTHRSMRQLKLCNKSLASALNDDMLNSSDKLREKLTNQQFALDTLAYFPANYSLLTEALKSSKKILARTMICRPETIFEAPQMLQNNKQMMDIANDQNIFSRYIKLLEVDGSILEYASKTFLYEPHKFFQLADIAIDKDPQNIVHIFHYVVYFSESILAKDASFIREKIKDFKDIDALLSVSSNNYLYDEYFIDHQQTLNNLLINSLILLDKDTLSNLVVSANDLRLLLNNVTKSLDGRSFFDFPSFIGNIIQSDFLVNDIFPIIFNVFADKEKLVSFFPTAKLLLSFIYDLTDINEIFEKELYDHVFYTLSPSYLASLCHTKDDFENLLKCLSLAMQLNFNSLSNVSIFIETTILYDFIEAFEDEKLQSFYTDATIDYEHFIELLEEFQIRPSLLETPEITFALRNVYQLIENKLSSHLSYAP